MFDMLRPFFQKVLTEAGCDEAGRGCLAGPVFAAAVILPPRFRHPLLDDSKKMKEKDRYLLRDVIREKSLALAVASVDQEEIDRINILKASFKAMHLALDQLQTRPGLILVDGHLFSPYPQTPHRCIVKGDATYASIAAASVIAKTYRDDYMINLHAQFPDYRWDANKGYGTLDHRKAIESLGLTPHHRKSFQVRSQRSQVAEGKKEITQ